MCSDIDVFKAELLTRENELVSQQCAGHVINDHWTISAVVDWTNNAT